MKRFMFTFIIIICFSQIAFASNTDLVWPSPPDEAKLQYIDEINCLELDIEAGFFGKIGRLFTGDADNESLSLPFDIVVTSEDIFLTCQNIQALIKVNKLDKTFKFITDKKNRFIYPLALCADSDGTIYISDVEQQAIYIYKDNKLKPFITKHLIRPTGLTVLSKQNKLFVVDTGDHSIKTFNLKGEFLQQIPHSDDSAIFHYPTFITQANNSLIVNDALNYKIKTFNSDGEQLKSFGMEGSGPGTFSRSKGIAVDSDEHIYVVDNLADNFQIFSSDGKLLLSVGSRGHLAGQFWSPAGIDIYNDTIYIADTYNNRIQIFQYLGDQK